MWAPSGLPPSTFTPPPPPLTAPSTLLFQFSKYTFWNKYLSCLKTLFPQHQCTLPSSFPFPVLGHSDCPLGTTWKGLNSSLLHAKHELSPLSSLRPFELFCFFLLAGAAPWQCSGFAPDSALRSLLAGLGNYLGCTHDSRVHGKALLSIPLG